MSVSRQHVVNLCKRGDLPFVTTGRHRRVQRRDVETLQARTLRLTRDQARSLWLGYALAGQLVANPQAVINQARANLNRIVAAKTKGQATIWLSEWDRILSGPVAGVLDALTSRSPMARELRQNSPFAGVLDQDVREAVLHSFYECTSHGSL